MRYKVTIAPDDNSGTTTTVVVESADGAPLITEVHVRSEAGLTNGRLPEIRFDLLLAAFAPTTRSAIPASATEPPAEIAATTEVPASPLSDDGDTPTPDEPITPAEPIAPVTTSARPRRRAAASRRSSTADAAAPAAPRKRAKASAAPSAGADEPGSAPVETRGGRQYRRMPADFREVYRTASTAKALAEHYNVPRYTAQGWIGRLKHSSQ